MPVAYPLDMSDAAGRRARALQLALSLGDELGVPCEQARVVEDSNNTIVHLAPSPIIAKVGTTTLRPEAGSVLTRELRIGQFLAERGAPIAPPTSKVPAGPYVRDETILTLWDYSEHVPDRKVTDLELANALKSFHEAFASYPAPLPSFTENLDRARDALINSSVTADLPDDDRTFLLDVQTDIATKLEDLKPESHPLHGDPHLDGNILFTDKGPLFVDFEAACSGPYEWDLTSLESARLAYPEARQELLKVLSKMRSLCVATSCWIQYGRAPEVTEAAHVHLGFLREETSG